MNTFNIPEPTAPMEPLEAFDSEPSMELDEHMGNIQLIEDAIQMLGVRKPDMKQYPDYYDELLLQLIDTVPLN